MAINAHSKYLENAVNTAGPEELTLMLYNGLIRFITQAQKAIENKEIAKAHEDIIRAENIIIEFQATLDTNFELSASLMLLYEYMHDRLVEGNLKKDPEVLQVVIGMATELRDTWAEAMKLAKQQQTPSKIAAEGGK